MTSQTFNLELIPQGVPPIIHVSQYDKGQTWLIDVTENGIPFTIPADTSATVQGTKPDNTGFQYSGTADGTQVEFTLQEQMTVLAGEYDCELVLVNGNDQVATINFTLQVEPAALDNETIISETELPLIEQAVQLGAVIDTYAQQIHADAQTAASAVTATAASEANAAASATAAASSASTATQAADDALASQTVAASSASNAATSETNAAASATAAATSEANAAASAAAAQAAIATDMTGATTSADGAHGLVPQPLAGDEAKFLKGDGTWDDVPAQLSGLTDVDLNNLADGQLLRYNATSQKWENKGVDSSPTASSGNLVESGGVYSTIGTLIKKTTASRNIDLTGKGTLESVQASISSSLSGYTPIAFSWRLSDYAGQTNGYFENVTMTSGSFSATGYFSAINDQGKRQHTVEVYIVWIKNEFLS